jgi:hypothetical protein
MHFATREVIHASGQAQLPTCALGLGTGTGTCTLVSNLDA